MAALVKCTRYETIAARSYPGGTGHPPPCTRAVRVVQIGVFADCNKVLIGKLEDVAEREEKIEMESHFCRYGRNRPHTVLVQFACLAVA